jgi:hypothetical protein
MFVVLYRYFVDGGKAASLLFYGRQILPRCFVLHWQCPIASFEEKSAVNKVLVRKNRLLTP